MNIQKLEEVLEKHKQPKFRLGQIQKAVFQDGISKWNEATMIPASLREILEKEIPMLSFGVEKKLEAVDGQSTKALLKLADGNLIETVLMSPKPGDWSVCVSSQVGCPMNCGFCATGMSGFKRNLTAEEISDQVLFWRQYLKKDKLKKQDVSNIVYMGMGEPFLNWEEVSASLKNLIDPKLFGFGSRSISISTVGIPEGIERMAEDFPQVNLAISLHFADDEMRSKLMPINKKYNLDDLKKALQNYFQKTKRKIFIEYVMLSGINDSSDDARKLANYLYSIGNAYLLHVNLIRYNNTDSNLASSSKIRTQEFRDFLVENRINATIRKSLGEEIQGACGQLAGK